MFSSSTGKTLIGIGLLVVLIGLISLVAERFGLSLFKLPGDIIIKRESGSIYFLIVSCVVLSVLISKILYLLNYLK
ncbi:hypothetical protein GCM10009117_24100 [Gangjinia marincola]|uniref:DUF2905 domain-containing protein n=1 Tax=Gangjinia marincola TaxID=578463 RepID=A0ABN1MJ67_9FLAO